MNATTHRSKPVRRLHAATQRVISHRAKSKAAKVHLFVRANRERPRMEVVKEMQSKFDLTESTARNWFQTYKTSVPDIAPVRRHQ